MNFDHQCKIVFKQGKYCFENVWKPGEFFTVEVFCLTKARLKTDYMETSYIEGNLCKKFVYPEELEGGGILEPFEFGWKDTKLNRRVSYSQYVTLLDGVLYYGSVNWKLQQSPN